MSPDVRRRFAWFCGAILLGGALALAQDVPPSGPAAEKRFPPLRLPDGFKATLFACDPYVEYPSAICAGPRPRSLFVAVDYMTGLGTDIVRRDEVRLLDDTDGDGYADRSKVFADGFGSIMGLEFRDGTLYVMHAPLLTAVRDTDGDGAGDERRDLLRGLGLTPEENPVRLHCANGIVAGHDGWLHLALGDHGCDVPRPEGDRLVLHGGGILRCRPDGRDLHVLSRGLRNVYDVALDDDLNVFLRDNENDGGTYLLRVCHTFFGADHGYPYLYEERPDEALAPLADLGRGSSAGGTCYRETAFPPGFRGDLFFCEWGRSVVRCTPRGAGSGFGPVNETEFASAAEDDPYGFKPTDLVVQSDGALFVADWADGQRPRRGRGRIYRIVPDGHRNDVKPLPDDLDACLRELDSDSAFRRTEAQLRIEHRGEEGRRTVRAALRDRRLGVLGRMHAVWVLARGSQVDELLEAARHDAEPRVRIQAVRAVADLADPVLARHRLDAPPAYASLAARVAALADGGDARIVREVAVALGRLRWTGTPEWSAARLARKDLVVDAPLAHAAQQGLRSAGNWSAVLNLLDRPAPDPVSAIALRAVADQYEAVVVDGLVERLRTATSADRRRAFADLLARVHRRPAPWTYWGYRPPPRPAPSVDWDRTAVVARTLDGVLHDADRAVRLAVLRRMRREKVPVVARTIVDWLRDERDDETVSVVLDALRDVPPQEARSAYHDVVRLEEHAVRNRLAALDRLAADPQPGRDALLLGLGRTLEDGPVLAEALRRIGEHPQLDAGPLLLARLDSPSPEVRAAAVAALGDRPSFDDDAPVRKLLRDDAPAVRRAAAVAAGRREMRSATDALLQLARNDEPAVRLASLEALRRLREPRVVPIAVAALADGPLQTTALECLGELGGPGQSGAIDELVARAPTPDVLAAAVRALGAWAALDATSTEQQSGLERRIAEIQGRSGIPVRWLVRGPVAAGVAAGTANQMAQRPPSEPVGLPAGWRAAYSAGGESRISLGPPEKAAPDDVWFAFADVRLADPAEVEFLASAGGLLEIRLDGEPLHRRTAAATYRPDSDRFTATLATGPHRILVQVARPGPQVEFHLHFRRPSAKADHERLTKAALAQAGSPARGGELLADAKKASCLKCHRIDDRGESIGPDLTGIGARFGRVYLVESILEPSRTLVPGFRTVTVAQTDGKVLTGVRVAESETTLTLADNQGRKHEVRKADVEALRDVPASTMPEGLEKTLTEREFVDLIAYLTSLKERGPRR